MNSIKHDSLFVEYCAQKFPQLPVIPNERAGVWYVKPELRMHNQSVYFKSTDGHFGTWDFSLKRLNFHIISLLASKNGCLVVDTTKRGKRFPDSLSKTIPIWCSVLNAIALSDQTIHTAPLAVSESERDQIKELIPGFIEKLEVLRINKKSEARIEVLKSLLKKPLRPIWVHPCTRMFLGADENEPFWSDEELDNLPYYPIVCVCASISKSAVENDEIPIFKPSNGFQYIQGAADDSEAWAPKFKSHHFWKMHELIAPSSSNEFLEREMDCFIKSHNSEVSSTNENLFDWIGDTGLAIGSRAAAEPPKCWQHFDAIINCGAQEFIYPENSHYLFLQIPEGKKGQYELFNSLPKAFEFVKKQLEIDPIRKILVHCMQGVDRSVGISIALLLRFGDSQRKLAPDQLDSTSYSKLDVMNALLYVKEFRSVSAPTRATMKRLNAYFVQ